MPFPDVGYAPTANIYSDRFDSDQYQDMVAKILDICEKYKIADRPVPVRHAAVKYLGMCHLLALYGKNENGAGTKNCRSLCSEYVQKINSVGKDNINAAMFCGDGGKFADHENMLERARAKFVATIKSKKKRNLLFLMIGCDYGMTVTPPKTDDWVRNTPFA